MIVLPETNHCLLLPTFVLNVTSCAAFLIFKSKDSYETLSDLDQGLDIPVAFILFLVSPLRAVARSENPGMLVVMWRA